MTRIELRALRQQIARGRKARRFSKAFLRYFLFWRDMMKRREERQRLDRHRKEVRMCQSGGQPVDSNLLIYPHRAPVNTRVLVLLPQSQVPVEAVVMRSGADGYGVRLSSSQADVFVADTALMVWF